MASSSKSRKWQLRPESPKDGPGSTRLFITDYETSQTNQYLNISKDILLVGAEVKEKWTRYEHCFDKLTEIFKFGEIEGIKYTDDNNNKYLDVKIVCKIMELEVRIQHNDLYLIGFKKAHPKTKELKWYELRTKKEPQKIDGSECTGYTGNYQRMRCDKVKKLDCNIFEKAVAFIVTEPEPKKWIKHVVIIIKTLCESLRFNRVRKHFLNNSKPEILKVDGNQNWDELLNYWSKISKAIWDYNDEEKKDEKRKDTEIIISPGITFGTFEEMKKEILLIKHREKPISS